MELNTPTTAEYAEAFGVELPAEVPAEEPTAEVDAQLQDDPEPETEEVETETERQEMPPEERAVWAARRRNWEAKERQAMETATQARVDQVYADIFRDQKNPYTGEPINTEASYRAYITERDRRQQQEQLQKAGIDPQTIQGIVDRQMAPLRQQMEAAQLSAIQEKARTANARMETALKAELQKITAMDPNVKTLEDIAAMPTSRRFNELVQKGIGMEDAFYLANRKEVDERRMAAARAATQERMAGKGHLTPVGASGKTPFEVTAEQRRAYREFMPEATDAEIREAYEKAYKRK